MFFRPLFSVSPRLFIVSFFPFFRSVVSEPVGYHGQFPMPSFKKLTWVVSSAQKSVSIRKIPYLPQPVIVTRSQFTSPLLKNSPPISTQFLARFHRTAFNMEDAIKAQGDLVRKLKSQKADKSLIKAEVDKLLALKAEAAAAAGGDKKEEASQDAKKFLLKCAKGRS